MSTEQSVCAQTQKIFAHSLKIRFDEVKKFYEELPSKAEEAAFKSESKLEMIFLHQHVVRDLHNSKMSTKIREHIAGFFHVMKGSEKTKWYDLFNPETRWISLDFSAGDIMDPNSGFNSDMYTIYNKIRILYGFKVFMTPLYGYEYYTDRGCCETRHSYVCGKVVTVSWDIDD